jgi:hypothetical protein
MFNALSYQDKEEKKMKRLSFRMSLLLIVPVLLCFSSLPVYALNFIFTTLDYPSATTTETKALGIYGSNIVGEYIDASGQHGFLYDGTNWTSLNYPGAANTAAFGINGGNIVGGYVDALGRHGFLYDGTNWTPLDYPSASETPLAAGIYGNNVVGTYRDSSNILHGFLYDDIAKSYTPLNFPGANVTEAGGIYGGDIVGSYFDASNALHGFLYDGTTWTTLDYPTAIGTTSASGIYGSDIVGGYGSAPVHGFLYDGSNWTTLDYPSATNTNAGGIYGNNIVGLYLDAAGKVHGFLATATAIPEPSTLLLLGAGLAGVGLLRRRVKK